MKKKVLVGIGIFLVAVIVFLTWFRSHTKSYSPEAVASFDRNGWEMKVNYCKPSKKGRLIFGEESEGALQPYGRYWRTGANEATTFETNRDILFGDKPVKAGKYQLYTVPGMNTWRVALNGEWDRWGFNEADAEKDAVSIDVPVATGQVQEQLYIGLDSQSADAATLTIHWDQTVVKVPLQAR
jgi:hypothetical protein